MLIECACGCGEMLEEYSKNGYKRRYIHNHHTRNKHLSDETKRKLSEGRKGDKHWMYGKHLSEEHKHKISESEIGKKLSEEHIEKIIKANTGKRASAEARKNMSKARKGRFIGENSPCFGIKHSDEFKEKIRIANTGRKFSEEHKRKISGSNIGKKHSEVTKNKQSESKKGNKNPNYNKKASKDTRKKMSESKKGSNHPNYGKAMSKEQKLKISKAHMGLLSGNKNPNWQGGISFEPYCPKFNEVFKEKIRDAFGRKCFVCNKTEAGGGRKLSVHHVQYNKNCGCDDDLKCDFVPLCMSCHSKTSNGKREYWENKIVKKLRTF